jgi:hypothetical protein
MQCEEAMWTVIYIFIFVPVVSKKSDWLIASEQFLTYRPYKLTTQVEKSSFSYIEIKTKISPK